MGLNATNLVLQVKGDKSIASGFDHATRTGDNTFSIFFIDGSKVDLTIPLPSDGQDGISITGVNDLGNGKFTLLFSDGSESDLIQTVKGEKGDKGDKLTFNDLTDEEKASLKGADGFSPTITENSDNTDKIYKLDITTADSTFTTPNLRGADGQGGTGGGEENKIDSISVNGINVVPDENKNVDITVPDAYDDTDIRTELAKKADTDHTHTTVNGHTVESDVPVDAKFTDTVYDDTQVKTQIQTVASGLMDSVGYSADYKSIDIIAKNGVKKSVNVAPIISHASITELSDVDTTNKATGKALVYNEATKKHEYTTISSTDEKVKMDASGDSKYLGELLDNVTIANENGELKVKKLDGQEVTITEINYLKGLTMNVMDLVNMFSNGGVKIINTPVATYAELLTLDKSAFIEGISYLVYVLADENHDNAKTTYLVDKDSETPTYFGFADSQRDFTTNPIDLATEITGKLGIANMDSDAIKALFTVDDTYKTETATNNAFSTHGAKALYDELLLAIGNKANSSDLTAHKDDTDIHVSTEDRTNWDSAKTHADSAHAPSNAQENVLETVKVNGTALTPSNKAVNVTVPTTVAELTDSADYAKTADIPTTLPANGGNADTVNNHTVETDVPTDAVFTDTVYDDTEVKGSIEDLNSNFDTLSYGDESGNSNLLNLNKCSFNKNNISISLEDNEITVNGSYYSNLLFDKLLDAGSYSISFKVKSATSDYSVIRVLYEDGTYSDAIYYAKNIVAEKKLKGLMLYSSDSANVGTTVFKNMQIEKGTTVTPYEPYIPSVKMLAEENTQQNTEAMDLKMLGWTVPRECPVQNYVDKDGVFHQIVGRVDLGSLDWFYGSDNTRFSTTEIIDYKKKDSSTNTWVANAFLKGYNTVSGNDTASDSYDKSIGFNGINNMFFVRNTSYTDVTSFKNAMQGQYLYYELATEISMNVDGNEAVTKVNDSLSVIGKCKNLLNPTLQTTTVSGVTCTNNGDGTYTLNGTCTKDDAFILKNNIKINGSYRLVGCPKGEYSLWITSGYPEWVIIGEDTGNGSNFTNSSDFLFDVRINIYENRTYNNVVFKPMLTTNLSATYDDFVPYTGDGETLTHDVAQLKNNLAPKKIELQNVDERVTIQDNGSFIINGFAFVNLLVTFNETLPQWSNFVRLPRPKGDDVPVHCENSVRFTIYSQDNLPGDCGTYDIVQSGTEIRLLVNYEVA